MPRTKLQVTTALAGLMVIALYALWKGQGEIASGCVGGMVALGMKLLEKE